MIGFKWVCNAQTLWMTFLNQYIPYRFKTKICFGCIFIYHMQVLSVPLAWTWRYCQWYWQCLHILTEGALITCINHCHLLELTLLCLVDLWKLDESISNFKGAWCIYFYFISYRNTCTCMQSRPWSYYLTLMSRLSNVREILKFHYCNVTLYTEKETVPQGQNWAVCFVTTAYLFFFVFFILYIYIYIYFFFFFNTIKCLGSCQKPR